MVMTVVVSRCWPSITSCLLPFFDNDDGADEVAAGRFGVRVEFIGNVCQKLLYLILNFPYVPRW